MRTSSGGSSRRRALGTAAAVLAAVAAASLPVPAADHREGPIFGPPGITITNSRRDINDVFIFRPPANANNTVMIPTNSPFSTVTTPAVFDQDITYDFNIINRSLPTAATAAPSPTTSSSASRSRPRTTWAGRP
jgi:hypothetical protein